MKKILLKSLLTVVSGLFTFSSQAVVYKAKVLQRKMDDGTMRNIAFNGSIHWDYVGGALGSRQQEAIIKDAKNNNNYVIVEDNSCYQGNHDNVRVAVKKHTTQRNHFLESLRSKTVKEIKQSCSSAGAQYWLFDRDYFLHNFFINCTQQGVACSNIECRHAYLFSKGEIDYNIPAATVAQEYEITLSQIEKKLNLILEKIYCDRTIQESKSKVIEYARKLLQSIREGCNEQMRLLADHKTKSIKKLLDEGHPIAKALIVNLVYRQTIIDLQILLEIFEHVCDHDISINVGGGHADRVAQMLIEILDCHQQYEVEVTPNFLSTYVFNAHEAMQRKGLELIETFDLQPLFAFLKRERINENLRVQSVNKKVKKLLIANDEYMPSLTEREEPLLLFNSLKSHISQYYIPAQAHSAMREWIEGSNKIN